MVTAQRENKEQKIKAQIIAAEIQLVPQSFEHFLRHVLVQDPPPGAGILPFTMWPHMAEMAKILSDTVEMDDPDGDSTSHVLKNDRIIWLKARQIGATTILAAYALWQCYKPYSEILLFSQGETEASDFLSKCNLVYQYLPRHLQLELPRNNISAMQFENGSQIRAFPSTKKAGRGKTASLLIMDEGDFHEFFRDNYAALMPTVAKGGQAIIVSTSNYETVDSDFKKLYRGAPGNGYTPVFYNWKVVPDRDEQWYEDQRLESTDLARFEKENPISDDQALAAPQELASFDVKVLEWMRQFVCEPQLSEIGTEDASDGYINIYQSYTEQERYVAATDVSHGVGGDYSVTVIMTVGGVVVADIVDMYISPEELATHSMRLLNMYHNPWWAIEDNDQGIVVVRSAERRKYPRQHREKTSRGSEREGWHADGSSRDEMWGDFKAAVNSGGIRIPNEAGLAQLFQVVKVRREGKLGRDEASGGGFDDYPTACGIAWHIRHKARSNMGIGAFATSPW